MKRLLNILLGALVLVSCQEGLLSEQGASECVLELDITRADVPVVVSRAADAELAVTITDANGQLRAYYSEGYAPDKVSLAPGVYTVCAYSENQDTWHLANQGKGEPCYYATLQVIREPDSRAQAIMSVPMTNYAVGLKLPNRFGEFFHSYQLVLKSGDREVAIREEDKAYFSVEGGGFTYTLSCINNDGEPHTHTPVPFPNVQRGKLFLLDYGYDIEPTESFKAEVKID